MSGALVVLGGDSLAGRELLERLQSRGLGKGLRLISTDAELATLSLSAGELRSHTPDLVDALGGARAAVVCSSPGEGQAERLLAAASELPVLDLTGALAGPALDARRTKDLAPGCWSSPTASALVGAALIRAAGAAGAAGTPSVVAFEPISELGSDAVNEMHAQAVALLNFSEIPTEVLGAQAVHDLTSPGVGGALRLARLRRELTELAGRPVSAARVQVGVFHGAGLMVRAEIAAEAWSAALASESRLAMALTSRPATPKGPVSPVAAVKAGRVLIARIDDDGAGGAWAFAAADTHEQGAVGNAVELLSLLP